MANEMSKKDLLNSLVDIRDVKIDRTQPVEERMKSYVEQIKNPYLFKVGNTVVVYDAESIEIVWKFNEIKKDTDNNVGVGA